MADCLFCKIVAGEIPATVVRESTRTISFRDVNPQAPTHVLVIPRDHYATVGELARRASSGGTVDRISPPEAREAA